MYKIGDWVRILSSKEVLKIPPNRTSSTELSCIEFNGQQYFMDNIELWQPGEGEWCFFHNGTEQATLAQYQTMDGSHYKIVSCYGKWTELFKYCEPFIGQLPSIKDSHAPLV